LAQINVASSSKLDRMIGVFASHARSVTNHFRDSFANRALFRRLAGWAVSALPHEPTLAQRLGFDSTKRVLIVNADDFGLSLEQNRAIMDGMHNGIVTSASVMVPCSGFKQVCDYARSEPRMDLGVHLTLNSEWRNERWRPVLAPPLVESLIDLEGYFHQHYSEVVSNSNAYEVKSELRAQIERAVSEGIDVTHLDSHMCVLHGHRAELNDVYLSLAREYSLPIRAASTILMHWHGFSSIPARANRIGLFHPDHFGVLSRIRPSRYATFWRILLHTLPAGVTEISCHLSYGGAELPDDPDEVLRREAEFRFLRSVEAHDLIKQEGIQLVGYRLLRDAMREQRIKGE
jgi:predicted glycoside hydrolase/deacetylase ChbG (UPF0249 family)